MSARYCPEHGALSNPACIPCRRFRAWVQGHGYPEQPAFEDWALGVLDAVERMERGETPEEIRVWLREERAAVRQNGSAA